MYFDLCESNNAAVAVQLEYDSGVDETQEFCGMIGQSEAILSVYQTIGSSAKSNANIFVRGESGTGKELCARAVHTLSNRSDGPFVAINCAAIPRELFESEFFGHVKGAFTGAFNDRIGAIQQANGGTLFLDEICEMDLDLQAKLLRFLQSGEIIKVGKSTVESVDVRVVCATNRDPLTEVKEGRFREDLYYRLNVVPIILPPLRERYTDVKLLLEYFLELYSSQQEKDFRSFDSNVMNLFKHYPWNGNVRELQNVVENIVTLNVGTVIDGTMLPAGFVEMLHSVSIEPDKVNNIVPIGRAANNVIESLDVVEKRAIESAIQYCNGNVPVAAAHLQVSASTLYRKLKKWGSDAMLSQAYS